MNTRYSTRKTIQKGALPTIAIFVIAGISRYIADRTGIEIEPERITEASVILWGIVTALINRAKNR